MSNLEREFDFLITVSKLPQPERQFRFSKRRWRLDFAWPEKKVAVEIHGGVYSHGRHTRGVGFTNDCEKMAHAAALGWRVLPFTGEQLRRDPVGVAELVRDALKEE